MKAVVAHNSLKAAVIGWVASRLIRMLSLTLRYHFSDPHGVGELGTERRLIWIFWHNRILCQPIIYRKYLRHRRISVLTSASKDGAIIAQTVKWFGLGAVRGSSSKRGAQAVSEMVDCLQSGSDMGITPDGPRGPRYKLAIGPVRLAQITGAQLVSLVVNPEKYWQLRSWDRFRIPKPFSRVQVSIAQPISIASDAPDLEIERQRVETYLTETQPD